MQKMENEVSQDLFISFLKKRALKDLDLKIDPAALVEYARTYQSFTSPAKLFDEKEWKIFRDILWHKVINEDKTARKLAKPWLTVITYLQRYQAEKKIAAVATVNLEGQPLPDLYQFGNDYDPCPPPWEKR